ncbi:MAG TPA: mannonate dehydratase [Acetobacteraceae bacterium]|jgi:mannonate dehydratase|nr:mannonate dehydratase [Acetobacteraceae bacterium]
MEQTWRWFGPADAITLAEVRQTGATGIVTALHDVPYGEVWSRDAIAERKAMVEAAGLRWSVVESLPVSEAIKLGDGDIEPLLANYRESLANLGALGIRTVCYNFMPVLDWTRTELAARLPDGGTALRFNAHEYAAFDCFLLRRPGAEAEHPPDLLARAKAWVAAASEGQKEKLLANIMAGLPGAYARYDIPGLRGILARYADVKPGDLRANLARFLRAVVPAAEAAGVRMCIHPDDPPRPLFGLPRVASTGDDLAGIVDAVDSPSNGITLCTGSLGARGDNDCPAIAARLASRIQFVHLRNVAREPDGSFMESDHLDGDVDMVGVVSALLNEQRRRKETGDTHWRIPFRPDHGHELLDDANRRTHPGYPLVGRMRGLAELRGVMTAVAALHGLPT